MSWWRHICQKFHAADDYRTNIVMNKNNMLVLYIFYCALRGANCFCHGHFLYTYTCHSDDSCFCLWCHSMIPRQNDPTPLHEWVYFYLLDKNNIVKHSVVCIRCEWSNNVFGKTPNFTYILTYLLSKQIWFSDCSCLVYLLEIPFTHLFRFCLNVWRTITINCDLEMKMLFLYL